LPVADRLISASPKSKNDPRERAQGRFFTLVVNAPLLRNPAVATQARQKTRDFQT